MPESPRAVTTSDPVRPWVRRLADLMDARFRIPGTPIRFGLDTVLGIVPGVGDTVGLLLGLGPLVEARRLGLPWRVVLRMLGNLAVDWLLGLIPLADLVLDTVFKANLRNLRLLERALDDRAAR